MNIPRIRKSEQVVNYFRERDKNSVVTKALIENLAEDNIIRAFRVGRNKFFNLDEIISALSSKHCLENCKKSQRTLENKSEFCTSFTSDNLLLSDNQSQAPLTTAQKKHLLHPYELLDFFKTHDEDCPLTLCGFRSMAKLDLVFTFKTACGHYLLDLNEILSYFGGDICPPPFKTIPRLRNYERCYFSVRKWTANKISWHKFHDLVANGSTFSYWHSNRWIVNYDLVKAHFRLISV